MELVYRIYFVQYTRRPTYRHTRPRPRKKTMIPMLKYLPQDTPHTGQVIGMIAGATIGVPIERRVFGRAGAGNPGTRTAGSAVAGLAVTCKALTRRRGGWRRMRKTKSRSYGGRAPEGKPRSKARLSVRRRTTCCWTRTIPR